MTRQRRSLGITWKLNSQAQAQFDIINSVDASHRRLAGVWLRRSSLYYQAVRGEITCSWNCTFTSLENIVAHPLILHHILCICVCRVVLFLLLLFVFKVTMFWHQSVNKNIPTDYCLQTIINDKGLHHLCTWFTLSSRQADRQIVTWINLPKLDIIANVQLLGIKYPYFSATTHCHPHHVSKAPRVPSLPCMTPSLDKILWLTGSTNNTSNYQLVV